MILGSYGVKVREGEATIAGAILTASDDVQWVHAPHCHAVPVLRTTDETVLELHPHPAARGLRQLSRLNPAFAKLWNEPASQEADSGRSSKSPATFQIVCAPCLPCSKILANWLCQIYTSEDVPKRATLQELVSPAEWNKKISGLLAARHKATPVIFLCGPKSSGKSTFGRLLANRLITDRGGSRNKPWSSVMVLDLDPGQPEYSPPGVVSLSKISAPNLSPSFCHPTLDPSEGQVRAHAIASVTPALDPAHFLECALDLLDHYQRNAGAKCPLVINTPGWIQGTGLDILTELITAIRPTEVIYMSQDGPEETVKSLQAACSSRAQSPIPFSTLPSQPSDISSRTPLHLRTMQMMSYFHLRPQADKKPNGHQQQAWDATPLSDLRPWRVRYRGGRGRRGFLGILCYDHQPAPDLLAEAVNGTVVALVRLESRAAALRNNNTNNPQLLVPDDDDDDDDDDGDIGDNARDAIPLIANPNGATLDPRHSRLLGLALVRGVDTARRELQLLLGGGGGNGNGAAADLAVATEGEELVLVAGRFDTPSWAYAERLYAARGRGAAAAKLDGGDAAEEEVEEDEEEEESEESAYGHGEDRSFGAVTEVPWVEMLHGSQRRAVGSKVWRVRRDLGRN